MPEMNREEIAKLEALYASNPEGRVFTHLAEAYRKAGEFDRARRILEQGLNKHPGYASAYVVLGRVQLDLKQNPEAEASFRRVLELDPHNLVALRSLGDLARAAGDRNQALAYFEELRHQDPGNDEVESFIAELRKAPVAPEPEREPQPESEPELEAPSPAAAEASPDFAEEQARGQSEPEPEPEPLAPQADANAAAPEPVAEASPEPMEPETELDAEVLFVEESEQEQELEIMGALEDFAAPERDYGDLVTPDIELNWEGGQPLEEESALPGDLADFAGLNSSFDIRDESAEAEPEPPPPEEMPEIHFPDVGEPADIDAELAEAEADEEAAAAAGLVTETMAQLYRDQGLYGRAAEVYRQLLTDRPYDAELARNLAEVEALASIIGSDQTAPEESPEETTAEALEAPEPLEQPKALEPLEALEALEPLEQPEALEALEPLEQPESLEQPIEMDEPFVFSEEQAPPFDLSAPEAAEPPEAGDFGEVASPWTTPQGAVTETPNPYTWTEEQQPEEDSGQPVQSYFRELLAWRPARITGAPAEPDASVFAAPTSFESPVDEEMEPEPEVANFASPPELEGQPAILELTTPSEPPAIPADELMPWEEPASPSMPAAAVTPSTPVKPPVPPQPQPQRSSGSEDPVEAAFDEWFSAVDPTPSAQSPAPPPADAAGAAPAAPAENADGDDDDDLEMFRSWLQSLKK